MKKFELNATHTHIFRRKKDLEFLLLYYKFFRVYVCILPFKLLPMVEAILKNKKYSENFSIIEIMCTKFFFFTSLVYVFFIFIYLC